MSPNGKSNHGSENGGEESCEQTDLDGITQRCTNFVVDAAWRKPVVEGKAFPD